MRKLLAFAIFLVSSIGVFSQEKTIAESDFQRILGNSFQRFSGKTYRQINIQQSSVEFLPSTNMPANILRSIAPKNTLVKSVTEYQPHVGYYASFEFNSETSTVRREMIVIADKTYLREGNSKWAEALPKFVSEPECKTKVIENQIEYKFLGTEKLDNQKTDVYSKTERSKVINLTNNMESFFIQTIKYWIGEGSLIKFEINREISNGKTVDTYKSTSVYELDPNIRIEAPSIPLMK